MALPYLGGGGGQIPRMIWRRVRLDSALYPCRVGYVGRHGPRWGRKWRRRRRGGPDARRASGCGTSWWFHGLARNSHRKLLNRFLACVDLEVGQGRFLNVWTGSPKKFAADSTESEDAFLYFSRLLEQCHRAYITQLGVLMKAHDPDSAEYAALAAHKLKARTVDDYQFLTCEFAKILAML